MTTKADDAKANLGVGGTMEFHYQKTAQYRVHHVDGAVGGPTPRGKIAFSFFSERPPIPRVAKRSVVDLTNGLATMGPEEPVDVLGGIVRQIEATVMMDLRTAQEFYTLLGEQLALLEKITGVATEDRVTKEP